MNDTRDTETLPKEDMDAKKAIIFADVVNLANKETLIEIQLNKLREYAKANGYEVIQEFKSFENADLGESKTFSSILDAIEKQDHKIYVICYDKLYIYKSGTEIHEKYKTLSREKKIELRIYAHPCFKEPENNSIKIWRYITLPKFIDLLQSKSLFFTRADFLREDDSSESAYFTRASLNAIETINKLTKNNINIPHPTIPNLEINQMINLEIKYNQHNEQIMMKKNFINCWHKNDFESFAMWKIYSDSFGVCISSTYQDLYSSFVDDKWSFYDAKRKIYIGEVRYIDWDNDVIPRDNAFWPYMHKKREFSYENELRCIIGDYQAEKTHIKVKVDVERLINKIHINPFTPRWFFEVVVDLCDKYHIGKDKIIQSSLI